MRVDYFNTIREYLLSIDVKYESEFMFEKQINFFDFWAVDLAISIWDLLDRELEIEVLENFRKKVQPFSNQILQCKKDDTLLWSELLFDSQKIDEAKVIIRLGMATIYHAQILASLNSKVLDQAWIETCNIALRNDLINTLLNEDDFSLYISKTDFQKWITHIWQFVEFQNQKLITS